MAIPQMTKWPRPGTGTLHEMDRIFILGVALPLAEMPSGGTGLDIEKRKQPGSDYSTYVSQGLDVKPIKVSVRLFRDIYSGKDWWAEWEKIRGRLLAKKLDKRNAVPVYHPFLDDQGISSLIFTEVGLPRRQEAQFFTVELEGRDPRAVKGGGKGTGASKKVKQDAALRSKAGTAAEQARANTETPADVNKGRAAGVGTVLRITGGVGSVVSSPGS